ncbi:stage II sporulation protein D [Claveliimonas bilis]|uniref:SpoIID/LytB domain-containing protein n=1 Tax=Claveliimonas bilis TaxID=3028070 RepID=UPI0029316BE6|nr:SpoIID/LytB domain-containing protein [Claveliimonas bilis]BDZ84147.1 stage II sporulation protein D [Claveliimonas bilis]
MRQKLKKMGCYIIIIVLLPYVVTVFLNGPSIETAAPADEMEVMVKQGEKEIQLPLDEYGIGRMAKEIPASYEEEAIKVQAILVRTAVYKQLKEEGSEAVLADDFWTEKEMKEEWGSRKFSEYYRKMENAWQETEGQVVMCGEELANTPFTRLTNGSTRDGKEVLGSEDYPYLKIKECPLDIESKDQIRTVTTEDMDAEIKETDTAGYVTSVRVGEETMSGEEFREKYKLDSSCFILQKYDGKMRITTRGVGHGLGLSQYTANEMAKEEKTTEEILQYFFEGTEIREVAEIIRNSGNTE